MDYDEAQQDPSPAYIAVITCAVLEMEISHFARQCPRVRHVEVLPQGLHTEPARLRDQLQQAIYRVENTVLEAEVIVLGYGLCSRGTEGVSSHRCHLVVPRAHDCITLLLGANQHYADYVRRHPGTYWYSPGWNKHHLPPGRERYDKLYREYCEKYGADNAEFLMETEQHWFRNYNRATYVDLTVGATDADLAYTRRCADWLKWEFDHVQGDPSLVKALVGGPWDDQRFLVLEPGQRSTLDLDADRIIRLDDNTPPCAYCSSNKPRCPPAEDSVTP